MNTVRMVIALMDCTAWPNDSAYLQGCLQAFNGILSMGPTNSCGLVLSPLEHAQTKGEVVLKNRRKLEDFFVSCQLDTMCQAAIQYAKAPGAFSSDRRKELQMAWFVTVETCQDENVWTGSQVFKSLIFKEIPLIRVADMLGYDETVRPSPIARIEQTLFHDSAKYLSMKLEQPSFKSLKCWFDFWKFAIISIRAVLLKLNTNMARLHDWVRPCV